MPASTDSFEPVGSSDNASDGFANNTRSLALNIRPAVTSDSEALSVLWRDTAETLTRLDRRLRLAPDGVMRWRTAFVVGLDRPDQHTVVAERGRIVIGSMTGQINTNSPGFLPDQIGVISELIVDSHGRGGGIGTQMYDLLSQWFAAHGVTIIEARVPATNPIAQAFWRASGASDINHTLRLKPLKMVATPDETYPA